MNKVHNYVSNYPDISNVLLKIIVVKYLKLINCIVLLQNPRLLNFKNVLERLIYLIYLEQ